jgi:type I restriction enzyme M protein
MTSATIVQKLWNYCNVLRDDGMSYGDYVEQLTRFLFLKVIKEKTKPRKVYEGPIPKKYTCYGSEMAWLYAF